MGLEVLFWIWVLTWMAKRGAEDLVHAVKGTPNPRYELKKAKAKAAGQPVKGAPRYGGREWFADLYSDALAAHTERRRAAAKAKAAPLDDLVEAVREVRHPHDPNNTRNCPVCKGEVVLDGRPCPRCLAEQERRNAEWAARHETPEPPPRQPEPKEKPVPPTEPDNSPIDTHVEPRTPRGVFDAAETFACPGCGMERYPAGRKEVPGLGVVCLYCQHDPRPDARIIQFPNVKLIEKEITMANSEATGLSTAIAFAEAAAQAHASFSTAGSEGYAGALEQMGFGEGITALAGEAREQSTIAAEKWKALSEAMEQFQTGREFYANNPDAPDKVALVNE